MELLALVPLKGFIFTAGFGGLITVLRSKYKNFTLGKEYKKNIQEKEINIYFQLGKILKLIKINI